MFLFSPKVYQDVCSGWGRRDVESRVQGSDLWDLPETEHKHSGAWFGRTWSAWFGLLQLQKSAIIVWFRFSVSCNNACRVSRRRRLMCTALKMRCGWTSFLMFISCTLKVKCYNMVRTWMFCFSVVICVNLLHGCFFRWSCSQPLCQLMFWRWRRSSCEILFESWSRKRSLHWRVSSSST